MSRIEQRRLPRLGAYLRRCRTSAGLSLDSAARRAGTLGQSISPGYIWKVENGRSTPTIDRVVVLGAAYGVRQDVILQHVHLDVFSEPAPDETDPNVLRSLGIEALRRGEPARAFACFERGLGLVESDESADHELLAVKFCIDLSVGLRQLTLHGVAETYARMALASDGIDDLMSAFALRSLGAVLIECDEPRHAVAVASEARRLAAACDERHLLLSTLGLLAAIQLRLEDYAGAIELYDEAIDGFESSGDRVSALRYKSGLALALVRAGQTAKGISLHRLTSKKVVGRNAYAECHARKAYGESLFWLGRLDEAAAQFRASESLSRRMDYVSHMFMATYYLREIAEHQSEMGLVRRYTASLKELRSRVHSAEPEVKRFDKLMEESRARRGQ